MRDGTRANQINLYVLFSIIIILMAQAQVDQTILDGETSITGKESSYDFLISPDLRVKFKPRSRKNQEIIAIFHYKNKNSFSIPFEEFQRLISCENVLIATGAIIRESILQE